MHQSSHFNFGRKDVLLKMGGIIMGINILEALVNSFAPSVLDNLGKRLGISPAVVRAATPMVVGFVLSALKRLTAQQGAQEKFNSLLNSASDLVGSRDMATYLQEADPAKSTGLLDTLTGKNSIEQVASNFAHKSGLDPQVDPHVAARMIGMMTPAVLNGVSSLAKKNGLDMRGIADAIDANKDALASLGNLDDILDDAPGIVDNLKRGLSTLFGRG
jgi:hypothetical protein